MSAPRLPIPLPDYQRIVRVLKAVYDTAGTHGPHAATFFSVAGARVLEQHYRKKSQPVAGTASIRVDDPAQSVVSLQAPGGQDYHCWVVCDGYVIDFMAPVFADALRSGFPDRVSKKMFQKPVTAMADSPLLMQQPGDFYMLPDVALTRRVLDAFVADDAATDLVQVCTQWYRRPPKDIPRQLAVERADGGIIDMSLGELTLDGVW